MDREKELEIVIDEYRNELKQLDKYTKVGQAISEAVFALEQLKALGSQVAEEPSQDEVFLAIALNTAFVVAYGRIFNEGNSTRLQENDIPAHLADTHKELMVLRNKRYSHNDLHHSNRTSLEFKFDGNRIVILPKLSMSLHFGPPENTAELLEWISKHMRQKSEKLLSRLGKQSRYEWSIALPPQEGTQA